MTINLDTLRKRAELPNALHGCSSDPCGSVVCQTARDRDELLSRLEQAEQDRVKLRKPFGCDAPATRRIPEPDTKSRTAGSTGA